jgi:hypothetical protein
MDKTKSESYVFEWFLVVTAVITVIIGLYESYSQRYFSAYSILSFLHSHDYLKEYSVVFEPGQSIWRLIAWIGSAMMLLMMLYSVRKWFPIFRSLGSLRHWLSAHMFLGVMGPTLITFHTTFKFGGLVATSYWCMIITMVFGILGRYIYIQIPRSIAGAELAASDIDRIINTIDDKLGKYTKEISISKLIDSADEKVNEESMLHALLIMVKTDMENLIKIVRLNWTLKRRYRLTGKARKNIILFVKRKAALIRKKNYLATSRNLLHYWHVMHIPLAIVMFVIMFGHIIVYYLFRPSTSSVL